MPSLAVIVVSYNTSSLLRECLAAIVYKSQLLKTEIIVVDNNSSDDSVEMVRREFPGIQLIALTNNVGFGAANNIGVKAASADFVMLLNSDAILLEDTGGGLVRHIESHPDVVCAGPRINLPNGERQPRVFGNQPSIWRIAMQSLGLGGVWPYFRVLEGVDGRARPGLEQGVGWISGVCMAIRRTDFIAVGGFDPGIFMYCEDIDLCLRLTKQGGRVIRLDGFPVRHYGGASSPKMAAQLRNALWVQRNLLQIIRKRSGAIRAGAARVLLSVGLLIRVCAGLATIPSRGICDNLLLRSSWLRMLDLLGMLPSAIR